MLSLLLRRLGAVLAVVALVLGLTGAVPASAATPTISVGDVTVSEGGGKAEFTVTLSEAGSVTVDFATANGTATTSGSAPASQDYTARIGTLQFTGGALTRIVEVVIANDTVDEIDETFSLNLSNASGGTITDPQGIATITDNDDAPSISVDDVTVDESQAPSILPTEASFTVQLSGESSRTITVDYATADGTAKQPGDYTSATGTLTFEPGDGTSQTVDVTINDDDADEPAEDFFLNLTAPSNATLADNQGRATIAVDDDDTASAISIGDVTVAEGNAGEVDAIFTVELDAASGRTVTVNYATSPGVDAEDTDPATADGDYDSKSGTITFAPGDTSESVTIKVNGDTLDEPDETFNVTLSAPTNASIDDGTGVGTITDDDAGSELSIADVDAFEGNGTGTTEFVFTVSLAPASALPVTVQYYTQDGTATTNPLAPGGADYEGSLLLPPSTLTFGPMDTTETISILVNRDDVSETNETFFVRLRQPTNATISDDTGEGQITNDDGPIPTITVSDPAPVAEGNTGTKDAVFTVTLAPGSDLPVTVNYATEDGTATGGEDYEEASGTLVFAPGDAPKQVTVTVNGDTTDEVDETFALVLSAAIGAEIDGQGDATITDDDAAPTVSITDVTAAEGHVLTTDFTLTVNVTPASGKPVVVHWATADGTATAGSDYSAGSGDVTIEAGDTSADVDVTVTGDLTTEANETFFVNLSAPTGPPMNATLTDSQGIGTITNDDTQPALSISNDTGSEGEDLVFTVTLEGLTVQTVTVEYATADGTATVAGDDYESASGTLEFTPGTVTQTIEVPANADGLDEPNETFVVNLSNATNATILDGQGEGTIVDDDGAPTLSVEDTSVEEGDAGTNDAVFTIRLLPASSVPVIVEYVLADGTATEGDDYQDVSGLHQVEFAPGDTSEQVRVDVEGDTAAEPDETFTLTITDSTPETAVSRPTGTATIIDDDGVVPSLSINNATITEGTGTNPSAEFTVTLSPAATQTVTVDYATSNGTASAGSDYTATSGTLTFTAGQATKPITVPVIGDSLDEPNETFTVTLSSADNADIGDGAGTGTINDDDGAPTVSVREDVAVAEGDSGTKSATFTIDLSPASGQTVTVDYVTVDDTATPGSDYDDVSGRLTFAPGETSKTVSVPVHGDTAVEDDEVFLVVLDNPSGAELDLDAGTDFGIGVIVNDDVAPPVQQRYVLVGGDGAVYPFNAPHHGDLKGVALNAPVIGLTMTPTGNGYWLVAKDGGIFTFGDAAFFGSTGSMKLNAPMLGMEATPTGKGYWLFAADGGIFTFGDAPFFGSTGGMKLNAPMIGMETTGSGDGYWLVAQDGGIFTFGAAPFHGSTGSLKLNQPVFDMAAVADGSGYWLVAKDGGIFTFGAIGFYGSAVGQTTSTVVGMRDTPSGVGYWIADAAGKVMVFGDAVFQGDARNLGLPAPIVGFAAVEA